MSETLTAACNWSQAFVPLLIAAIGGGQAVIADMQRQMIDVLMISPEQN